ncbi:MAG TPA: ABC transporter permease, partial [Candidatus Atribacteria bacterium]|nr:ABC transporter permease [Candidatus Atribacteria bacterium]
IGFFLFGSALIAVGLFISTVTENQVVAAVATFTTLLILWLIDAIIQGLPTDKTAGIIFALLLAAGIAAITYFATRNIYVAAGIFGVGVIAIIVGYIVNPEIYTGFIARVLEWFSLYSRYEDFQLGILSLSPIVYYITFSSAFIFLSIRMLEKKRWS